MIRIANARLGRVLAIYASTSFVVLQAIDLFQERLQLPEWLFRATFILLVVGLPIVVMTAIVQSHDFKSQLIEKSFTWKFAIGGGVTAFLVLLVGAGFYARDRFGGNARLDANLVAVFPFRVNGAEPSLRYLSEGMVDLLAAKLAGEDGPRAADARTALAAWRRIGDEDPETEQLIHAARSIGARRMIAGAVTGSTAQLTISASVTDTRTGRSVQHFVTGPADSLPQRVDALAAVLLSLDAGEPRDRLASLTSTSLPAVRAYLLAEDAYRRANHTEAARHYLDALDTDSSFGLAGLGVLVAAAWSAQMPPGARQRAARIAWANRSKMSELDRLKLEGYLGSKYPYPEGEVAKCRVWQQIVARAPDRAEAVHNVADCIYHFAPYIEQPNADADARAEFEKSMALDSTFLPNIQHLLPLAAKRHDVADARRLAHLFLTQDSTSETAQLMRWYVAYAEKKPFADLVRDDTTSLIMRGEFVVENGGDAMLADSLLSLAVKRQAALSPQHRANPLVGFLLAIRAGRFGEAARMFDAQDSAARFSGSVGAVAATMYSDYDTLDAARRVGLIEPFVASPRPADGRSAWNNAACFLEQWRLWHGDATHTDAILAQLREEPDTLTQNSAHTHAVALMCATMLEAIRATVQKRADALVLAMRVDSITRAASRYGAHHTYIRLVASRLLELNGDLKGARSAVGRSAYDMPLTFLLEAEVLQRARLSAKLGDRATAIRDYQRFLAFRSHADGRGAKATDQARRELTFLVRERQN